MTDTQVNQLAIVAVTRGVPQSNIYEFAAVAVCGEQPPVAGGARVLQFAMVTVSKEFYIPIIYVPLSLGAFMQTMPYYVGRFE